MQIAKRDLVYTEHSRFNKPRITVVPGEEFIVETELCSGDWLHSIEDTYSKEKAKGPNPCVVIGIEGAMPGDVLAVKIKDIEPDELGYTGFDGDANELAGLIYKKDWGLTTKTLRIADGKIEWSDKIKLPVRPMIGTLGTAPEREVLDNSKAGPYGGNMDVNEVTVGSTVYLPVFVADALLHVGDVHAIQGDGEINLAGGVECRAKVRLSVDLEKRPRRMEWIRIENEEYIMAVACCRSMEESFYAAARELLYWILDDYGFDEREAYLLMGQVMEARCTQFVNPMRTYICKMPKKVLV
ncbi:MAG: acetamidase/formamidase family protein [Clostridia bacterium]|jgi:amidase